MHTENNYKLNKIRRKAQNSKIKNLKSFMQDKPGKLTLKAPSFRHGEEEINSPY